MSLPVPVVSQKHHGSDGQHQCCLLSEQKRGDKVPVIAGPDSKNTPVVPKSQNHPPRQTHSREVQCDIRPVVSPPSNSIHRVVDPPQCSGSNQQNLGITNDRLVCDKVQCKVTHILFSNPGPTSSGSRCNEPQLGQHNSLRLPTSGHVTTGVKQSKNRKVHSISSSSGVDIEVLVPKPPKPTGRLAKKNQPPKETAKTTNDRNIPPNTGKTRPTRLEVIQQRLRAKGFSKKAALSISQRCRGSTNRLYETKWQIYCNWCDSRQIDSLQITEQQLSDFFLLFGRGEKARFFSSTRLQGSN